MITQTNKLKEDPYFDGDELQIKLQELINTSSSKTKISFSNEI